jgi:NitT/TauT family transport system substrate-binding protein/putative hydroxymethylpyrimidine transport system substrate-binding protein
MRRVVALLATVLLFAGLAGCGGDGAEPGAPQGATLMLDFTPNAVHTGIYVAKEEGFYRKAGVGLEIEQPGNSTDAPKLLAAGRVDFAILDIHDLGIARERGLDLVGVMPIVNTPLASVLTRLDGNVRRPRELEGRTVGVTGLPSDDAVVDAEVKADGGDPAKVKKVTIGFNAVSALAAKKVDAVTGFWNAEGVELERLNVPLHEFIVDSYGAPKYPELVLATSGKTLEDDPELVEAVVDATTRGYDFVLKDPNRALEDFLAANPSLGEREQRERLSVVAPYLRSAPFKASVLREWAGWDLEHGILEQPLDVEGAFDLKG